MKKYKWEQSQVRHCTARLQLKLTALPRRWGLGLGQRGTPTRCCQLGFGMQGGRLCSVVPGSSMQASHFQSNLPAVLPTPSAFICFFCYADC